jgi:hypothetical protein
MRTPPDRDEEEDGSPVGKDEDQEIIGDDERDEDYSKDSGSQDNHSSDFTVCLVKSCMKSKAVPYDITKRKDPGSNAVHFRLSCNHMSFKDDSGTEKCKGTVVFAGAGEETCCYRNTTSLHP